MNAIQLPDRWKPRGNWFRRLLCRIGFHDFQFVEIKGELYCKCPRCDAFLYSLDG